MTESGLLWTGCLATPDEAFLTQNLSSLSPPLCNERGPRSSCLGTRKLSGSHVSKGKERTWEGDYKCL